MVQLKYPEQIEVRLTLWRFVAEPLNESLITNRLLNTRQLSGSTISTLLHDRINPKDCQVLSLGESGFLQFFRVVSRHYGKPRSWFVDIRRCMFNAGTPFTHIQCAFDSVKSPTIKTAKKPTLVKRVRFEEQLRTHKVPYGLGRGMGTWQELLSNLAWDLGSCCGIPGCLEMIHLKIDPSIGKTWKNTANDI